MMRAIGLLALLAILDVGAAVAQTGNKGTSPSQTTTGDMPRAGVPEAPIGHRQPRASDMPNNNNVSDPNDPLTKENRALDRKIKSICRGC
jgi:hypothetical protein